MISVLSIPLETLAANQGNKSEHVSVDVELMREKSLTGELLAFLPEKKRLELLVDGKESRLNFTEIRSLRIAERLMQYSPKSEHLILTFHIKFRDGEMRHGLYSEMRKDATGLHLVTIEKDGGAYRLFVPRENVLRYRLGDLQGGAHSFIESVSTVEDGGDERLNFEQPVAAAEELGKWLATRSMIPFARNKPVAGEEMPGSGDPLLDASALSRRLGVPLVDLKHYPVDARMLAELPESFVREHAVFPLMIFDDHLVVAMENPADGDLARMIQFVAGKNVETCVATRHDLVKAIDRYYGASEETDALQELEGDAQHALLVGQEDIEKIGSEKPIVRLVHNVLVDAIHRNASDIHIRPGEEDVELLYREDGTLIPVRRFSKALLPAVVARIKIIGRMNIAERRLPQDGRARMETDGAIVDMRISVIPTITGESVVIRLLNAEKGLRSVKELGFDDEDQARFIDLLHKSYGMLLVTGPTGSGKSTTLYAAIQEVRKQNVNIITVEDPVEYHMAGIEQIQVNTAPGFTFARALRNILRHDPDVVMVGEIRDQETAKIAVESALTGHLVLSTLHTNDAPTAITRLIEMGVESFLVKSSVLGVLAQRLVRLNCTHCLEQEPLDKNERKFLGVPEDEVFYHGKGCEKCNNTGFKGRKAVYELLVMTPAMREIIRVDIPVDEIRDKGLKEGMVPLTQNALALARAKLISLAEVYRVRLE